ncbi:RagB/SusD family nutrient uptake outer membrane protein [Pedobacter metabolipauper]|uniref:Putative outer membrane starch-binding protein n=1 Tax=Pedobacter metabolipauper TaxID=425513 RepID=A0A4R6ST92_9SPHI|nr:RagB/SusD family nutrient uptake outer membrane protein [Pedobacter metabolipauper]TDQ08133.1 putative outer membrane starch-binding protein [Pedobacter metabolipauper]
MKVIKNIALVSMVFLTSLSACKKNYLDIVPDNLPTLDNSFTSRVEAEKFLFTCYSFLPREGNPDSNPGFNAGDELWFYKDPIFDFFRIDPYLIARGRQNKSAPYMNYWGENSGTGSVSAFDGRSLWQGIRDCNIMLENIDRVNDLQPLLRDRWIAEVKFLKAYYHWYLFRMYGPIPVIDENLPVSADPEAVKIKRQPVDSVVNYITKLIDEAVVGDEFTGLPSRILNQADELGRITKVAALSIKAKVLVTAASPMFNGNTDFRNLRNKDGEILFNQTYDPKKWTRATEACRVAVDAAGAAGVRLYTFPAGTVTGQTPEITTEMSIRNAVAQKWNTELIWGSTSREDGNAAPSYWLQLFACPQLEPAIYKEELKGQLAPTFKMAELFYTKNGVPIEEDDTWDYANRFKPKATPANSPYLIPDYQTAGLHFDREPRFYADMAFDGAKWYMKSNTSVLAPFAIRSKALENSGKKNTRLYSITGYYTKKVVNWNLTASAAGITVESYPWPIMRLADLMLLYAEALNESGNGTAALPILNEIRSRAGLGTVESSWGTYAKAQFKNKYSTVEGLRDIIRRERGIELAFEANRFWDLRRWKTAAATLNNPIYTWNISRDNFTDYNQRIIDFNQTFVAPRDYLWPISDRELQINSNLVQNTGW